MNAISIDFHQIGVLSDEQLFRLCSANKHVRFERTKKGEILVMSPTGGLSSRKNFTLIWLLGNWNNHHKLGVAFDSSGGFRLPNGAMRAPDASWLTQARWDALSLDEQKTFPPLCPDFIIELMSESDDERTLMEKMEEWRENGCRLAWLINPSTETCRIYRADGSIEIVRGFDHSLNGEDVLPNFVLELHELR